MAKVLVTFEDDLLRRIDQVAKLRGLTRSAYLSQLAARATAQEKGPGADPAVHRALARIDEILANAEIVDRRDSTVIIREERDARAAHVARLAGDPP
jgi:hypothetical protein